MTVDIAVRGPVSEETYMPVTFVAVPVRLPITGLLLVRVAVLAMVLWLGTPLRGRTRAGLAGQAPPIPCWSVRPR